MIIYKISVLLTKNEQSKIEIKKIISFTVTEQKEQNKTRSLSL